MTASVIDGKRIAEQTRAEAAEGARRLLQEKGVVPHLAAVLVGEDPASAVYVRNKQIACQKAGFKSTLHRLAATTSQSELMALVQSLNADPDVHGILVQLPLPKGLDATTILDTILPSKDVDGFHAENVGLMSQGRPRFLPCTPAGVMRMLKVSGIATSGTARGGDRPQRHRRQADGDAAGAEGRGCHGHACATAARRTSGRSAARPTSSWLRSASRSSSRATWSSRARS